MTEQGDRITTFFPYDWNKLVGYEAEFTKLAALLKGKKLPQSLMLAGRKGLGKKAFAHAIAASLYCPRFQALGKPCMLCFSCTEILKGTFLDLKVLDAQNQTISNKIAKDSFAHLELLPRYSAEDGTARRIVLILGAESMTSSAVNSVLKIVEEPPAASLIIFTTSSLRLIKETLRSRCSKWLISPPKLAVATKFLTQHFPLTEMQASQLAERFGLCLGQCIKQLNGKGDRNEEDLLQFWQAAPQMNFSTLLVKTDEFAGSNAQSVLNAMELHLNRYYRDQINTAKTQTDMLELRRRRAWLRECKLGIIHKKIPVNVQLILDRFSFLTKQLS